MKWVTREHAKVDRIACPWLIKKWIDPEAEFVFVPKDQVMEIAENTGAIPFDVPGVKFGHHDGKCTFEALLEKYHLDDPALQLLAQIVHGADVEEDLYGAPEAPGLKAIAEGFLHLGFKNDHEALATESIVYDALYAYCKERVAASRP